MKKKSSGRNQKSAINLAMLKLFYELSIIAASSLIVLISLGDLIWEFSEPFMAMVKRADFIVITVFAVDLVTNLILAKNKKRYLKKSLITIICVVPFSSFFRLAALLRLNGIFGFFTLTAPAAPGLFSRLWTFFMLPGVARISKFFNLGKSYYDKNEGPQ